jgi:hypothetical protein
MRAVKERKLGPVVGLGTWNTLGGDLRAAEVALPDARENTAAAEPPRFGPKERAYVERFAEP